MAVLLRNVPGRRINITVDLCAGGGASKGGGGGGGGGPPLFFWAEIKSGGERKIILEVGLPLFLGSE